MNKNFFYAAMAAALLASLALWLMSCTCAWAQPVSIVPQPAHIEQQNGSLTLRADMTMAYSANCEPQAEYLRKTILGATAYNWSTAKKKSRADVVLEIGDGFEKDI